jgi:hypothetical protein
MTMTNALRSYFFETRVGTFFIVPRDGRWHIKFDGANLGSS